MKIIPARACSLCLFAIVLLPGCGNQAEEDAARAAEAAEAAERSARTAETSQRSLAEDLESVRRSAEESAASAQAEMQAKLDEQREALQAEMNEKLEEQRAALLQQFQQSNAAVEKSYDTLKTRYETAKPALPEQTASELSQTFDNWGGSIETLKSMVASFSPGTIEELESFQRKYSAELSTAKEWGEQALSILQKSGIEMPRLDARSLGF